MDCPFTEKPKGNGKSEFVCPRCYQPTVVAPTGCNLRRNCRKGLGDWTAGKLKKIGITEKRVKKVFGGCKCKALRHRLNFFGWKVQRVAQNRWAALIAYINDRTI